MPADPSPYLHSLSLTEGGIFDICVLGGGPSGVAAACAAGASGLKVLLVEKNGYLGGALTAVTLGSICGLYCVDGEHYSKSVGGFLENVIAALKEKDGVGEPTRWLNAVTLPYDTFAMKCVLDEMVSRNNVTVMFHSTLIDVGCGNPRHVDYLVINSSSGLLKVSAKAFIDCSGDAELVARSGGEYEIDFAELQFPTAMFRLGGVQHQVANQITRPELHRFLESAVEDGNELPRTAGGIFLERSDHAHLNITKIATRKGTAPNPLDWRDMAEAEMTGRRQIQNYATVFKNYVPGYSNSYVLDSGSTIGVRESRRIMGEYVIQSEDVLTCRKFSDAIARCSWPMEEHGHGRATKWVWLPPGDYFDIPYRSLVPRTLNNVIVAGRSISASHDAQASIRVTAQCFATGQAAGMAALLSVSGSCSFGDVPVSKLQAALIEHGAIIN